MKQIKIALLFIFAAGLVKAQNVTVKGNSQLNNDFSQYKTYGWAESDLTIPVKEYEIYSYMEEVPKKQKTTSTKSKPKRYVYAYSVIIPSTDPVVNTTIQNSINQELQGRGYTLSSSPDLVVVYRVLDKKARFKGYTNDSPTMVGATEIRQPSDTTTFILEPGTLLISLVDRKTSQVVWDGFASGLFQQDRFVSDETKLKEAVHLTFNEFKYRGDNVKARN